MDFDPIVLGLAGRGILDRQERERQAMAERQEYMLQVAAYMNQGYSIEESHAFVQDFYERQAAMQAQLPGPSRGSQIAQWDIFTWIGVLVIGGVALMLLAALVIAPFS